MFKYDICCEKCGKVVGSVSFREEPSADKIANISVGYTCEDCIPMEQGE